MPRLRPVSDLSVLSVTIAIIVAVLALTGCQSDRPAPPSGYAGADQTPSAGGDVLATATPVAPVPADAGATPTPIMSISEGVPTLEATVIALDPTPTPLRDEPVIVATPTAVISADVTEEPGALLTATATPIPTSTTVPGTDSGVCDNPKTHIVRIGDTLSSISCMYGDSVDNIKSRNGLTSDLIYVGQELEVCVTSAGVCPPYSLTPQPTPCIDGSCLPVTSPCGSGGVHVVQPGENLYRISLRYGVSQQAIAAANNMPVEATIYVGQRLVIPGFDGPCTGSTSGTHTVMPGETLYSIAALYGATVESLMSANNLATDAIYVGQVLDVP